MIVGAYRPPFKRNYRPRKSRRLPAATRFRPNQSDYAKSVRVELNLSKRGGYATRPFAIAVPSVCRCAAVRSAPRASGRRGKARPSSKVNAATQLAGRKPRTQNYLLHSDPRAGVRNFRQPTQNRLIGRSKNGLSRKLQITAARFELTRRFASDFARRLRPACSKSGQTFRRAQRSAGAPRGLSPARFRASGRGLRRPSSFASATYERHVRARRPSPQKSL